MLRSGSPTIDEKQSSKPKNNSSPALVTTQNHDLEAARTTNASAVPRLATTSPTLTRGLSPPVIFHPNGSVPASVTSLPVQGIEPAPTHRRRKNRRRRQQAAGEAVGTPGAIIAAPRRANSLPAPAMPKAEGAGTNPPFEWKLDNLLVPQKKIVQRPTLTQCFVNTVKYSWLNLLLVMVPVAWAIHFTHQSETLVFVFSFLAIIPLAALLGFATEEISNYVGPTIGGLFNATFGNAVELIISILALVKGELKIVQAAMLGSILSNCLLVLGMCFLAGGLRFHEQGYGVRIAQQQISLLSLCVFSISIPAAFTSSVRVLQEHEILAISRATAIILLICYIAFLVFQLWTHSYLYSIESSKRHAAATFLAGDEGSIAPPIGQSVFRVSSIFTHSSSSNSSSENITSPTSTTTHHHVHMDEDEEVPKLTGRFALALLLCVTVITGVTAEFLVDSINGLISTTRVTEEFVALILLPLVGNAAEHVTAVTVSVRNKLDLALAVAVGSSIQIALFVLPFLVILGWWIGQPLSLNFDTFESVVVVVSVIVVNFAISDGRTNWLEGFVLMVTYVLIGVAVFYYN
ncbi:calcium/proton exchanger [Serendipita vermifera]|nr:calcium/proton exchanger [Serendipita vermifera]